MTVARTSTAPQTSDDIPRQSQDAREDLKRTLERDTAVQGEGEEDVTEATHRPDGADSSAPSAQPAPGGRNRSK